MSIARLTCLPYFIIKVSFHLRNLRINYYYYYYYLKSHISVSILIPLNRNTQIRKVTVGIKKIYIYRGQGGGRGREKDFCRKIKKGYNMVDFIYPIACDMLQHGHKNSQRQDLNPEKRINGRYRFERIWKFYLLSIDKNGSLNSLYRTTIWYDSINKNRGETPWKETFLLFYIAFRVHFR